MRISEKGEEEQRASGFEFFLQRKTLNGPFGIPAELLSELANLKISEYDTMTARYIEQLERTKRYLKRFSDINAGIPHTQASPNYEDDVYAFFQNCYHLKDWIKNDQCFKMKSNCCIELFVNSNDDLRLCADICNGLKHLTLTHKPRSNENPRFAGSHISLNISEDLNGASQVGIAISYRITTSSKDLDAFDLARRCVSAWDFYLANHNCSDPI